MDLQMKAVFFTIITEPSLQSVLITYSDLIIYFFNTVGPEYHLSIYQYMQEENTSVVEVHLRRNKFFEYFFFFFLSFYFILIWLCSCCLPVIAKCVLQANLRFCGQNRKFSAVLATVLNLLTNEVNNKVCLITMQWTAGKVWVIAFMWMLLWSLLNSLFGVITALNQLSVQIKCTAASITARQGRYVLSSVTHN